MERCKACGMDLTARQRLGHICSGKKDKTGEGRVIKEFDFGA